MARITSRNEEKHNDRKEKSVMQDMMRSKTYRFNAVEAKYGLECSQTQTP